MCRLTILSLIWTIAQGLCAQEHQAPKNQRLDFAKTYFEYGGSFMPSFTGKELEAGSVNNIKHPASISQYLTWGGFHFWGHAEFYVTIPLDHHPLQENSALSFKLIHSVTTGARIYPWAAKKKSLRPYAGFSWGALDFQQTLKPDEEPPTYSKDFMLNLEAGASYHIDKFGARFGLHYFPNHQWKYPLSRAVKTDITTPPYAVQLGLFYTFDSSKKSRHKDAADWNDFPSVSRLSYNANNTGDFFMGMGPSSSYSLKASEYNQSVFPYLKERLLSKPYFDIAMGYQFNHPNLYIACSFRNPVYETSGFGTKQTIHKTSLTLELAKYLTDYTGFAPYAGVNIALDQLRYAENSDGEKREMYFNNQWEPGFILGWDIAPGKSAEALILRTNIRWYPFAAFEIDGKAFNFSQLEYNLIQAVFYPGRLIKNKSAKS